MIRSIGPIFGTILEYCETSLLIFYAHAIASEIFPESGVLAVYCVPLISIIFRPLGGYLIGLIGDKHGPESAMRISSLLMSASSFLMCFLPSYQEIGIYSQLLLVILRGAQMLSAGGELNFAAISLIERCQYKNLASGIAWAATSVGWLSGYLVYLLIGQTNWRIAFLITSIMGLLILPFRTARPRANNQDSRRINHPNARLVIFFLAVAVGAFTYYTLQYCRTANHIDVILAYIIAIVSNIVGGYLNDIYGNRVMRVGLILSLLALWFNVFLLYPLVLGMWKAPTHAINYEMYPDKKCSNIALWYALGTSIAGQGTMLCCAVLDQYLGCAWIWGVVAIIFGFLGLELIGSKLVYIRSKKSIFTLKRKKMCVVER